MMGRAVGRRVIALVVALVVVAGAIAFALRGRLAGPVGRALGRTQPPPAAVTASAPSAEKTPSTPQATPRGDVTIDPRRQQLMGVRTVAATRAALSPTIRTVGAVRYDETRLADVNLKVEGFIRDLVVAYPGQPITKGQPLFTLYSPDVSTTESEYVMAVKTRDLMRESQLPEARARADQRVAAARGRLALWDVPSDEIRTLEETQRPSATVTFRSPATGFVIEKQALKCLHLMPRQRRYKIPHPSVV